MGMRMAPSFANLFIGKLEHSFMQAQSLTPPLWIRFLDDVLMVWSNSENSLKTCLEQLNQFRVVQFTWSIFDKRATFLDVDITLEINTLTTSVHIKPTNLMQYLHYPSSHPYHTKKTISFSLALRGQRLNSTTSATETHNQRIQEALDNRGYTSNLVTKQIRRASSHIQSTQTSNTNPNRPVLITQFHFKQPRSNKSYTLISTFSNPIQTQDQHFPPNRD